MPVYALIFYHYEPTLRLDCAYERADLFSFDTNATGLFLQECK